MDLHYDELQQQREEKKEQLTRDVNTEAISLQLNEQKDDMMHGKVSSS